VCVSHADEYWRLNACLISHDHAKPDNNGRSVVAALGEGNRVRAEISVAVFLNQE
jgi:hypothetical protein